jgi:type I restriction enzyme M protein
MFLVNKLSKMKETTPLGSRIAEVHNASSLFTGDAGQGESDIRRWIIENDWLEAVIALPENMFYNTGIATYIWVLSNRKAEKRRGKVQLIDAGSCFVPLRRNLGKKNCELSEEQIREIYALVLNPRDTGENETPKSKLFPNAAFGYWKITVERPLRLAVDLSPSRLEKFESLCAENKEASLSGIMRRVAEGIGVGPHLDFNVFMNACENAAEDMGMKLTAKREKLLRNGLTDIREDAEKVVKKIHRADKADADPLHGLFETVIDGGPSVVEYEPDTALRDTEQIPLLEEGGIEVFFRREVLPYVADAWIDPEKTQIGYEISFTRHFYKPVPMRKLEEIDADIDALRGESEGLLERIMGETEK